MELGKMERYWSQDAQNYSKIINDELKSFRYEQWKTLLLQHIPKATKNILDIGCGPGFFSILLTKLGYRVTGIDCSTGMLRKAMENSKCMKVQPVFFQMDCENMEFENHSFDLIVSRNVTWTLQNPDRVYKRCLELLRPHGKMLIFDANWHLHLFDRHLQEKVIKREAECMTLYGDVYSSETPLTETLDIASLPLSSLLRPQWDIDQLKKVGFKKVYTDTNLAESLWDEKEKLLYGESLLFGIFAEKG